MLDRIRFRLNNVDAKKSSDEHAEFTWFAREYPRCYRHHLNCATFRLRTIAALYKQAHAEMVGMLGEHPDSVEVAVGNEQVARVYWDFESFLSEICIALDLLARIAGTAYEEHMPVSFNKFCKRQGDSGLLGIMKKAQLRWVNKLKDYRDCFTHYTPIDTVLLLSLVQYGDVLEIRGKLPVNPNTREILGFRFSRRVELFKYACTVQRHMDSLDRAVAKEIEREFARNRYPKRKTNLFYLGARERA